MVTPNESMLDQIIRGLVGVVLITLALTLFAGVWQWIAGVVGAIILLSAVLAFCPVYRVLGMSTRHP